MAFEVFDAKSAKRTTVAYPVITIQANGVVRLNKAAAQALKTPDRVLLLWDRPHNKMGVVAATDPDDARAYRVSYESGATKLAPKAFLAYIGFVSDRSVQVNAVLLKNVLEATIPKENIQENREATILRTRKTRPDQ